MYFNTTITTLYTIDKCVSDSLESHLSPTRLLKLSKMTPLLDSKVKSDNRFGRILEIEILRSDI